MGASVKRVVSEADMPRGAPLAAGENTQADRKIVFWKTTEVAKLRDLCAAGASWQDIEASLPGRSECAVYQKVLELGLECWWDRSQAAANQSLDDDLRAELSSGGAVGSIKRLAEKHGLPGWYVSRRAGQIGLTSPRLKEPNWGPTELAIVDRYLDDGAAAVHRQLRIAGYSRTPGSVCNVMKRRRDERLAAPTMSARAAAEVLGVDGKTVARWIEHCGLKARQTGGSWAITSRELRRWLLDNPDSFDLRKVKQVWFMNLMKSGDIHG